ncbi:hypothetical protein DTO013E5_7989 [Penicillium roqueforti]|uniref:S-crystallin n=1 Tax=Penicillium roqueforti (strain FM164) TaxID=1365484 RepID=W6QHR3_PENRF|nr:uncharacterized protein LCP9604111_9433 [Penicillium roqueforti]CDM35536.1 S-crystallin [Penicillium roqueforti FM164]KAF9238617.1 hypothetical protein LCP9604111_9433 [Penicillium roqueforti]KAI1833789.1 hypothetical protein CBS147337_5344 [Penicillium roqueforti]KAI2685680.1 hypothetical protein CBS147355_1167 [Penicillium roqueforti]KAI2704866.1 hypothetical protein CBS147372_1169 [Penicillium roqueforti]
MSAHPDSNLYPEASGPAKALVDKHRAEQPLKLYAGWFCPFVQRVWLALEEKKIPYEYIEVNPYNKPDSLLTLNPRGLVPTLSTPADPHPRPLYESTVILEYLEEAYPDHQPRFLPDDAYERARARIWIDYVTSRIIPSFHRFLQYQPADGTGQNADVGLDQARQEFLNHLKAWTKEMHSEGPFFLGEDISLPDLVLAPWAVRLWVLDEFKSGGLGIPREGEGGADEGVWSRWRTWLAAVESRRSIKETTSDLAHYLPIYKRYADNTAQSELAKATRAGRGVP